MENEFKKAVLGELVSMGYLQRRAEELLGVIDPKELEGKTPKQAAIIVALD